MGIRFVRKSAGKLWRVLVVGAWCLLGLWAALAAYFTIPVSVWLAVLLGLGIAGLFGVALRERFFVRGRPGIPWREIRWSVAALAVTAAVAGWYFGFVTPNPNEAWIPQHDRTPVVTFEGDKVHVKNVRNFTWRTGTDFTPMYHDRVYDLNALNSMYFVKSPIFNLRPVSHVWVSCGFSDGQHVSISVEARGVKERPFGMFRSMFRQFQLIYVVGEERDVVGLRGAVWQNEVRFYPANTTDERKRALVVDMLKRADSLGKHPEFYNLIANNCMNNITYHVQRLGGRPLPSDLALLLTGFSDGAAYRYGFIDTHGLSFAQARQAFRIDEWMRHTPLDESFSLRLREQLARQVADMAAGKTQAE
jgi:hypothetical protein